MKRLAVGFLFMAAVGLPAVPARAQVAPFRLPSSAATTNLADIKQSQGWAFKIRACNNVPSFRYIKFYNALAASVTVGSTPVLSTVPLPASQCFDGLIAWTDGIAFKALSFAIVTGALDTDATPGAAGDVTAMEVSYR